MQIEFYTQYTITIAGGDIKPMGIREITLKLTTELLKSEDWQHLNPDNQREQLPSLPSDWQWRWVVPSGVYRGTLPKRISKYYWVNFGIKCPERFLAELGAIARSHTADDATYIFDFADEVEWEDGDFGDSGSCYWGEYESSRHMIDAYGMAIRFFDQDGNGYARAWIAAFPNRNADADFYVLFNGYGLEGDPTLKIAQIFAQFVGGEYRRVGVRNSAHRGHRLYVNGSSGYAIGAAAKIADLYTVDFKWEGIFIASCYSCDRDLDEDSAHESPDGDYYCESCFYDMFGSCDHCGTTYEHDYLQYVESTGRDVCDWCLDQRYSRCEECDEYYLRNDVQDVNGVPLCTDCADDAREAAETDDADHSEVEDGQSEETAPILPAHTHDHAKPARKPKPSGKKLA